MVPFHPLRAIRSRSRSASTVPRISRINLNTEINLEAITASSQAITVENLQAAESAIRDADIAEEVALLTRNQILVQTATAALGQANLIPQSVLQLLG